MKTYSAFKKLQRNRPEGRMVYTEAENKREAVEKMRNAGHNVLSTTCQVIDTSIEWLRSHNPNILIVE